MSRLHNMPVHAQDEKPRDVPKVLVLYENGVKLDQPKWVPATSGVYEESWVVRQRKSGAKFREEHR